MKRSYAVRQDIGPSFGFYRAFSGLVLCPMTSSATLEEGMISIFNRIVEQILSFLVLRNNKQQ